MRKKGKFISLTVLVVLVVASLIAQVSGIEHKIFRVVFKSPGTGPASVVQHALDEDGDGRPDMWEIVVREFRRYGCAFVWFDRNYNGTPDMFSSLTVNRVVCSLYDDKGEDGRFDRQTVGISDASDDTSRYIYGDIDLDGRIDLMRQVHNDVTIAGYLFMNETLVKVLPVKTDDWKQAWIETADGREVKAVFENGEWKVVR